MIITPTQMRAARAMLDVPQGHVAEHLGIAANTLSKIESGQSDISMSRLNDIQRFYEREGIAFTENDGVAFKSNGVETYEGRDGFTQFLDDVYQTIKNGGEVCVSNVQEDIFLKWAGDAAYAHMERVVEVKDLDFKILVEEGDCNTVASAYATYKTLPAEKFGTLPLYLYGDKTALMVFSEESMSVFVIHQKAVTEYFKLRFATSWNNARSIS